MSKENLVCGSHFADKKLLGGIKKELDGEEGIKDLAKIYKALGDPTRLRIIYVLTKSPLCVCDIAQLLGMSQSSISHQLKTLRDLNLVKYERQGKMLIYSLDDIHVYKIFREGLDHIKHQNV